MLSQQQYIGTNTSTTSPLLDGDNGTESQQQQHQDFAVDVVVESNSNVINLYQEATTTNEDDNEKLSLLPAQSKITPIAAPPSAQRMLSLDILRGMTVMLMIVVNNQPAATWWPFEHADWNGFTPTDCVFPFFLFISGYAIGITFRNVHVDREKQTKKSREENDTRRIKFCWILPMKKHVYDEVWLWLKILRRSCMLFAIGLLFSLLAHITDPWNIRVMGVMQRIGICYFMVCCLVCLVKWTSVQIVMILALQAIYLGATFGVKVAGCSTRGDIYDEACTAQAFFDQRILHRNNIYRKGIYDPEGFLSTLPAIMTTYMGVLYFKVSQMGASKGESFQGKLYRQMTHWLLASSVFFAIAFAIEPYFPFNKHIWSTSFAILTPAIAGAMLSVITFVVDVKKYDKYWIQPFLWVGSNPLLMYVLPNLAVSIMLKIPAYWHHRRISLYSWFYSACLHSWIKDSRFASLIFAVLFEAIWLPLAAYLHRKKIYVKL